MKRTLLTALMATALIPAAAHAANTQAGVNASSQVILGQNLTATDIRELQQALHTQGFYHGVVDGHWGHGTARALQKFQQKNSLQVGSLDTNTLNELGVTLSASGDANSSADINSNSTTTETSSDVNTSSSVGTETTSGSGSASGSVNNSTTAGPGLIPGRVGLSGSSGISVH